MTLGDGVPVPFAISNRGLQRLVITDVRLPTAPISGKQEMYLGASGSLPDSLDWNRIPGRDAVDGAGRSAHRGAEPDDHQQRPAGPNAIGHLERRRARDRFHGARVLGFVRRSRWACRSSWSPLWTTAFTRNAASSTTASPARSTHRQPGAHASRQRFPRRGASRGGHRAGRGVLRQASERRLLSDAARGRAGDRSVSAGGGRRIRSMQVARPHRVSKETASRSKSICRPERSSSGEPSISVAEERSPSRATR